MKMKHNKKRNTAFLYESLIKELTKSIINQEIDKKSKIIEIVKKYFNKDAILYEDLKVYRYIYESDDVDVEDARRYMFEVKNDFYAIDRKKVFNSQTKLIKEMHSALGSRIFSNFVPNYRTLASIGKFFASQELEPKSRILLEKQVFEILTKEKEKTKEVQHIDKLTYRTFVQKFNDTYSNSLKEEQQRLLTNYITSFSDNGLQLKAFLNEELGRLKGEVEVCIEGMQEESNYKSKSQAVLEKLNTFSTKMIDEDMIRDIFYIQNLVMEISKNGD